VLGSTYFLNELLPQPSSVGLLVSRGVWEGPDGVAAREAGQRMGISLLGAILESFEEAEYRRVFAAMKQEGLAGFRYMLKVRISPTGSLSST
jgi:hypothetical protein